MTAPDFTPAAIQQERERVLGLLDGITPGEWRTDNDEGSSGFLFALNEEGVNRMAASVTRGRDDSGVRASLEESHANSELMAAAPALARDYAAALGEVERLRGLLEAVGHDLENAVEALDISSALTRQYVWDAHDRLSALASAPEERP